MPQLSDEEVRQFVRLDEQGWKLFRDGFPDGAVAAFRDQLRIYPMNFKPYVSLALVEASRGNADAALEYLRQAVVRGYTDLPKLERSEAWSTMPTKTAYLKLQDAIPYMLELERRWPQWGAFQVSRPPRDLEQVLGRDDTLVGRIDAMAPALGPRMERLWKRTIDRATAAMLEAYVTRRRDADDVGKALDRLMRLYAGGPLQRFERLPAEAAEPLGKVAERYLELQPEGELRPAALVASALSQYARRDKKRALLPDAAETIRTRLGEVVAQHAESAVVGAAIVGLVRTESATGHADRAAAHYTAFRKAHATDADLLHRVQWELGALGLRVGGLPEFSATTLDGKSVDPAGLRGKVVVLDFWATWCAPCIEGFPALRRIDERHGDDVVVLGVNMDWSDDLSSEDLRAWIEREVVPGDHVRAGEAWDSELVKAFGVREIPFSVVVDAEGSVVAVNEKGKKLEKAVRSAAGGTR
jgi:thiol-disulfide isomerase/thioredoxin